MEIGMKNQKEKGFTLIELMIVVAIIGILAAIAMPGYQDFTTKTKWANNLTDIEGVKKAVRTCMNDMLSDGTKCVTVAQLGQYGFPGTALPTPKYAVANTPVVLTGTAPSGSVAGKVNIKFTAAAEIGSGIYSADCSMATDGRIACLAETSVDTIPDKYLKSTNR
jgi:type IV pilus assembly protein PilA